MFEPFQKAPLMSETRSSATDQEMSQTTLNKGQRQMDSVLKSWGFRTSRDPFQQNSTQGLEANKGQKSTPLREVVCSGASLEKEPPRVCPLERDDSSRARTGKTVRAARALLGRKTLKPHAAQWIYTRALGDSGVTKATKCRPLATRFFDVLTAPVFQEKKP
uniref:hypothetical protein n=1 Tax=Synechococcus sp. UW106 TaxID=368495 RepID=UPI001A7E0F17|nr:hypothetical protein [Synechococcus sp. UW106]